MSRSGASQELTPTVEQTAQQVFGLAKAPSQLIIVEGLSGVGKTALVNRVTPEIEASNGLVIGQEQVRYEEAEPDTTDRSVVVTATITREFNRGGFHYDVRHMFPEREVSEIILPGMPADETESFVAKLPRGEIEPDLVAYYSMGVPLLARRFMQADSADSIERRGIEYVRQATDYNTRDVRDLAKFLQMAVPVEFMPGSSTAPNKQIYFYLDEAEKERAKLSRQDIFEESPVFVAPESERIYNAMLQNENGISEIEIYIPQMSAEDFARIQQALGWDSYHDFFTEHGQQTGDYRQELSPRARMFHADYRKFSYWQRPPGSGEYELDNEFGNGTISATVESYQELTESGQLGLQVDVDEAQPSMWLHSHEHNGMPGHTARFGWMVESLLQQRGIAYFVNNETCDASYAYLPDQRRLQILPNRINIDRYRW